VSIGQRDRDSAKRPAQKQRVRGNIQFRPRRAQQRQRRGLEGLHHPSKGCRSDVEGPRGCAMPQKVDIEDHRVDAVQHEVDAEARRASAELQSCP